MRRILLALAVFVAACSSRKPPPVTDAAPAPPAELTPAQAAQVLAHVSDRTLTLGDFASAIEGMDQFDRMRFQAPQRRKELLNEIIDVMLLADEAREKHEDKEPVTQQEVRQILRDALLKKAQQGAPQPADLPSSEVKAYFAAHKADFHEPERRRIGAIVVGSPAVAAGLAAALQGAGASRWGELVRSKSIDAQAKANVPLDLAGDMGFVTAPGDPRGDNPRIPQEVRVAAFALARVGDVGATPVPVGGRVYVIKLTSKTDPHDRTFADAERTIRVKLAQDNIHARQEAMIDDLRTRFPVKVDEETLRTVKVDLPAVDAGDGGR